MATKRKTTTGIVAGVTAAALLLGGTFAWTSISQQAKNETAGIVNVGGRLHDDFDGENKDVYVENFTDPLNGGQPIYARIKLTEYMEVGQDAGGFGTDVNGDGKITAVPVVSGTDINNPDTWTVHVPDESCEECATTGTCKIHDHWEWIMGGQTTFMPTFNKDKDSLAADINGTYAGTNANDKIYYDDYVTYVTENGATVNVIDGTVDSTAVAIPEDTTANALTEANKDVTSVTGTAYYDDDPTNDENDHDQNIGVFKTETETHTAKQTSIATVMTMAEWQAAGSQPGNFWVYDTDGWAYWANPIMPGEATGLLLSNIEMTKNPGEKCYYAINVVAEFATVGDWEYFTGINEEDNANALALLEAASKNVATVTVTNVSGATLLTPGSSYEFSANVYVDGVAKYAASDFDWSVLNADKTTAKSTIAIDDSGKAMLTVAENETSKNLIIVAKATAEAYLGALGMTSVAVDVKATTVTVQNYTRNNGLDPDNEYYEEWEESYEGYMMPGQSYTLDLNLGDTPVEGDITWKIDMVAYGDTGEQNTTISDATVFTGNTLSIDPAELEYQSFGSPYNTWHIVDITGTDSEGNTATLRTAFTDAGIYREDLAFYDPETGEAIEMHSPLIAGKTYDVRVAIQLVGHNNYVTDYFDPISTDGIDWVFTKQEDNHPAQYIGIENGQFIATVPGEYNVSGGTEDYYINVGQYIEVVTEDYFYINYGTASVNTGESLELSLNPKDSSNSVDALPAPETATWALEGTYADGTSISQDGVLTVALGETATEIIVTADDGNSTVARTKVPVTVVTELSFGSGGDYGYFKDGETYDLYSWSTYEWLYCYETDEVTYSVAENEIGANFDPEYPHRLNFNEDASGTVEVTATYTPNPSITATVTFNIQPYSAE